MREHTNTPEKTAPRSFTLTDEQNRWMREKAQEEGITASALLRRWISQHAAPVTRQASHLSPWGGQPQPDAKGGGLGAMKRLGKCNPQAQDYAGRPCSLCWPNGAPEALRDGRGNITSWTLTEDLGWMLKP
jgi:hypothetical protein